MELKLIVEESNGRRHNIEAEVTNHGRGNKYLEADDGRKFKLYDDGRVKEICKYGISGQVVAGEKVA